MILVSIFTRHCRAGNNGWGRGARGHAPIHPPYPHTHTHTHTYALFSSKKKKKETKEKRSSFKGETIKRLWPRWKCYYFSHSSTSKIQKFCLSDNHGGRQYCSVCQWPLYFEIHFDRPCTDESCEENVPENIKFKCYLSLPLSYHIVLWIMLHPKHKII